MADIDQKHPVTPGWRKAPPTAEEVGACQWWWSRLGSCLQVMHLRADAAGNLAFRTGNHYVDFSPTNWGGQWAPCLPPPDEVSRG